MARYGRWARVGVLALALACSSEDDSAPAPPADAGAARDLGVEGGDAGFVDTGVGPTDAGADDAGFEEGDAGFVDSGVEDDAGLADAGSGCALVEDFGTGSAPSWPARWQVSGDSVTTADVVDGWGRLIPRLSANPYSLARMVTPGCPGVSFEGTMKLRFTDPNGQGMGFYFRANGGFLQATDPVGIGYAAFAENFRDRRLGVWKEVDGVELEIDSPPGTPLSANVVYNVRFRMTQQDATTTRLQAKVWEEGATEPAGWQVDATDAEPTLQNIEGGQVAIDIYSSNLPGDGTPPDAFVDDIRVAPLP